MCAVGVLELSGNSKNIAHSFRRIVDYRSEFTMFATFQIVFAILHQSEYCHLYCTICDKKLGRSLDASLWYKSMRSHCLVARVCVCYYHVTKST